MIGKTPKTLRRGRTYNLNLRLSREEYFALKAIAFRHKTTMTDVIVQATPLIASFLNSLKPETDGNRNDTDKR